MIFFHGKFPEVYKYNCGYFMQVKLKDKPAIQYTLDLITTMQ